MKILFDQGVPVPLRRCLHPHKVDTAAEAGWSAVTNGQLISEAERNQFDLLITTDQNLKYQQNLAQRKIRIIVLLTTSWPKIQAGVKRILSGIDASALSSYQEIEFD